MPLNLSSNAYIQPPLTKRGVGPAIIVLLPNEADYTPNTGKKPLDPIPAWKWAEEGFAVLVVKTSESGWGIEEAFGEGLEKLLSLTEVETKDKVALLAYDPKLISRLTKLPLIIKCVVSYGAPINSPQLPSLSHLPSALKAGLNQHNYPADSPFFVLPTSASYHAPSSSIAHTRSLIFLKSHLGGPYFDIEAVWEEHTLYEFEERDVEKTMATMVAEPYVNHVPTMTGGVGRKDLTIFYRDNFIFANPADTALAPVSRTVGADRIIDEFIFTMTHDREVPWFLPGVPPSYKKLAVPFVGVINVRGDKLYHEHIWWDQATALRQCGVLPEYVDYPTPEGNKRLRLPVSGSECARMLADETDGQSNVMFDADWGVH